MKAVHRLSAQAVARAKASDKTLMLHDGHGLYLRVTPSGAKHWLLRYMHRGKRHDLGLGAYPLFSLADARARATEQRKLLADGINPLAARQAAVKTGDTFETVAEQCIASLAPGWRSRIEEAQWRSSLAMYAYPILGLTSVADIDTAVVLRVLRPIWATKTETATRVRLRIERVLDYAATLGLRDPGNNPAAWRRNLIHVLPRPDRVAVQRHHAALPHTEIPQFMAELRQREGVDARALEFLILTACRTSEVLEARWAEIEGDVWTIPRGRMKQDREHRVPLSDAAMAVLRSMVEFKVNDYIFPGQRHGPANKSALYVLLKMKLGRADLTVHGFRSTFRDWCRDTGQSWEAAEIALAHRVGTATERAYARSDLLEQRRALMQAWARFCELGDVL